MSEKQRDQGYLHFWKELINQYGARCFYCHNEIATTIDHLVPYSWDQNNSYENLVPACGLCNSIAANRMFSTIEEKRQYILNGRKKHTLRHAICNDCLLPYSYRIHSPSLFLCASCYDAEYGTDYSKSNEWRKWLAVLRLAGMPPEAHIATRRRLAKIQNKDRNVKIEVLIDEYAKCLDSDMQVAKNYEDFAR